ncbi:MAG TPA: class I SAM-dependent methyltransferase [Gammaproteobacteria bacterium]|jgi:SAM-dependent methyltransferase
MDIDFREGRIRIDAEADPERLRRFLKSHEPWRHRIDFSGGISTADFLIAEPFSDTPCRKVQLAEHYVGALSGYERALDVGCNAGYNSLYLASRYGMQVLGLDHLPRHVQVSQELARIAGVPGCRFQQGDVESFRDPQGFDLILHFGTLYHLRNPVRALETAFANLRPGGLMLIETQLYGFPWSRKAAFIRGYRGDNSNWWALGERTLKDICAVFGAEATRIGRHHLTRHWLQTRALFRVVKPARSSGAS